LKTISKRVTVLGGEKKGEVGNSMMAQFVPLGPTPQ